VTRTSSKITLFHIKDFMPTNNLPEAHYQRLDALPEAQDIASNVQIGDTSRVTGNVCIGAGTVIENCIIRGPAVIGENCQIKAAYIGSYTTLGNNVEFIATEIEHASVEDGVIIRALSGRIQDSIIGKNSHIIRHTNPGAFYHFQVSENSHIDII
jgi:glucose-1-phosphate thymidylyltransferase